MKKIYKLGGFGISVMTPLALIACAPEVVEAKPLSNYFTTSELTQNSVNLTFKDLTDFVGKTLAVQVKKSSDTNWSAAQKLGITETNKNALLMNFNALEAGQAYDLKVSVMQPGSTTTVLYEFGTQKTAFSTPAVAVVAPDPEPGKEPEIPVVPQFKPVTTSFEILSPTKAQVNVNNLEKYVNQTLLLKYKKIKAAADLEISDFYNLSIRTATTATLNFNGNYLDAYKGKKLKIEYRKSATEPQPPASDENPATVSRTSALASDDGSGGSGGGDTNPPNPNPGDSTGGSGANDGVGATDTLTPTLPASEAWASKIVTIPANVLLLGLFVSLEGLETATYDLKLTVVEADNEATVVQVLGKENHQTGTFATSNDPVMPTVDASEKTLEKAITVENASKMALMLEGLEVNAKYQYSLVVKATATKPQESLLPYSIASQFNTANTTIVEKVLMLKRAVITFKELLERYQGETLTITLTRTNGSNTTTVVGKALVENKSASVEFNNLVEGTYTIQASYGEAGSLINLEGLNPADLNFEIPEVMSLTFTATAGPTSITLNTTNAAAYAGKNLVVKYAPKAIDATNEEAINSIYAKQVTVSVPPTTASSQAFSVTLANLEKLDANANANKKRNYVYTIVLEGTENFVTYHRYSTAETTEFVSVKINKTAAADNTVIYAGSSAKVKITGLEPYKGKKLYLRAVPNPNTTQQFLANFFPTDEAAVRKSDVVTVPSSGSDFDREFKILNLDSEKWYVFQVFLENELNPLLAQGFDFKSNVSPNTAETLTSAKTLTVKVSKLANSIGSEIQLKHAKNLEELNGSDAEKITTVTKQTISNDNKDSITFSVTIPADVTSLAYKIELKGTTDSNFAEAKEVVVSLPTTSTKALVGGFEVNLQNAKMLAGQELVLKYKKTDPASSTFTTATTAVAVSVEGTAVFAITGLEAGEAYEYQLETKPPTGSGFEILNAPVINRQITTLSNPIADVQYVVDDKTKVNIFVSPLYNQVGSTLKLQYRKSAATGAAATAWIDLSATHVVTEINKTTGVTFNLTDLEATAKYEFQIIDTTTGTTLTQPASFQANGTAIVAA